MTELKRDFRQTVDGALADYQMALVGAYGTVSPGWFKKWRFDRRLRAGDGSASAANANVVLAFNNAIGVFDKPENRSAAHQEIATRPWMLRDPRFSPLVRVCKHPSLDAAK